MIQTLFQSPLVFLIGATGLIIAITIHEFAHAWMADHLGDPTPQIQNRLTLNPLAHLDPVGTLMLLFFGFGWGKPVNFDPFNLENPRKDTALISLAGPLSNITLAILVSLLIKLIALPAFLAVSLLFLIKINLILAIFNLVPVYPLDGEKILVGLLPRDLAYEFQNLMRSYGTLILILLILPIFGQSPVIALISPIINFFFNLLT